MHKQHEWGSGGVLIRPKIRVECSAAVGSAAAGRDGFDLKIS